MELGIETNHSKFKDKNMNNVTLDPRTCCFCHLDKIFPVEGLTLKEMKNHDHDARIRRQPVEYKMIYVFAEIFSRFKHMVKDFRDLYNATNVNTFFSRYLPNTSMEFQLSGNMLTKIEKAFRKTVTVYTANGLLSEENRRDFYDDIMDIKTIKATYKETRDEILNAGVKKKWLDPDSIIPRDEYEREINKVKAGKRKTFSQFEHELAENIRINIANIVKTNEKHGLGRLDDILIASGLLAMYSEGLARFLIEDGINIKKDLGRYFYGLLFTPENRHFIVGSSFFLFPYDTAFLVCDLLQHQLIKECSKCHFKCLK